MTKDESEFKNKQIKVHKTKISLIDREIDYLKKLETVINDFKYTTYK